jgi:hypothetical protein
MFPRETKGLQIPPVALNCKGHGIFIAVYHCVYGDLPWSAGAVLPLSVGEAMLRPHMACSMAAG